MVTDSPGRLVTADELIRLSKDEFHGELIRGELCEEPLPGFLHGSVAAHLMYLLHSYVSHRDIGTAIGGAGVWLERDPDTVRAPDVQFFSNERLPRNDLHDGYIEVAPNLAIEVRSFDESRRKLHDKANMWLNAGVDMVWVVLPDTRSVDIYRPDTETVTVAEPAALDGQDVLPGFRCELTDIFGSPPADQPPEEQSAAST